jgi:hypothetical protein
MFLISGYEMRDRHILKISPTGKEDDPAASQMTGLIMNAMASQGGYDAMSWAFLLGSLVSGANEVELYPDRKTGDIRYSRLAHNEFLLDPNMTRRDYSDCMFRLRGKWIHEDQVKKLLPFLTDRDMKNFDYPTPGIRWNYLPAKKRMYGKALRLYEEFWRRDTRRVKHVVVRSETLGSQDMLYDEFKHRAIMTGYNQRQITEAIRDNPMISTYNETVDTIKLSILLDSNVVWDGLNPTGIDDYNSVLINGLFVPEFEDDSYKLQGLMKRAKDPQRGTNRRICQIMDIVEKRIQEAIVAREGSVKNWRSIYKSGQGLRLWLKKETQGPVSDHVHQLNVPDIPPGMFQLYDLLGKEAIEILGLNTEILGSDDKHSRFVIEA